MLRMLRIVLVLYFVCCSVKHCCYAEEQCSRYHYEEQILAKMLRLEYRLEKLEDKVGSSSDHVKTCEVCPDAWIRFNGSCYRFEEEKYSFQNARAQCKRTLGADLVHINDFAENEFLRQHLKTLKSVEFWIGLEDIAREGSFKWVDDNTMSTYTDWLSGQPDNAGGREDCVHFHTTSHKWNDRECHRAYSSICELKAKV